MNPAVATDRPVRARESLPRYGHLDAIRAIAATYVVIHHAYTEIAYRGAASGLSRGIRLAFTWAEPGHYAVAAFIVVSGYCLALPVRESRHLAGGLRTFAARRALRILPPYYAALGCTIVLVGLVPQLNVPTMSRWDSALPVFNAGSVLSHLALIHNLNGPAWIYKINPPMWSIATEWQIYAVFALVLVPIWRGAGVGVACAVAVIAGLAITACFPRALYLACPWYLGLFGFGMLAAARLGRDRDSLLGAAAFAFIASWVIVFETAYQWSEHHLYVTDSLVGGAVALLLATSYPQRWLRSGALTGLGTMSYSLYLVHFPLLSAVGFALRAANVAPAVRLVLEMVVGVPFCIAVAYYFHVAFERPCLRKRARAGHAERTRLPEAIPVGDRCR